MSGSYAVYSDGEVLVGIPEEGWRSPYRVAPYLWIVSKRCDFIYIGTSSTCRVLGGTYRRLLQAAYSSFLFKPIVFENCVIFVSLELESTTVHRARSTDEEIDKTMFYPDRFRIRSCSVYCGTKYPLNAF